MPLTHYALDNFVAQNLSKFTAPTMHSVAAKFPDHKIWLTNFVLNSIFITPLPPPNTSLAFAIIRRATAALEEYDEACSALDQLASSKILTYFIVQSKIENAISAAYQAFNNAREAMGVSLFKKGDGSPMQRLQTIYNRSRYVDVKKLPPGHLHAVWLQNDGIHSLGSEANATDVSLSFEELELLLEELASLADKIARGQKPEPDATEKSTDPG